MLHDAVSPWSLYDYEAAQGQAPLVGTCQSQILPAPRGNRAAAYADNSGLEVQSQPRLEQKEACG